MEDYLEKRGRLIKRLLMATSELEDSGNFNMKTYADAFSKIIKQVFNITDLSEILVDWDIFDYMFDNDATPKETIVEIINQLDRNIGE